MSNRPAISKTAREVVWHREKGICQGCGKPIGDEKYSGVINHAPALWSRQQDDSKPKSDPASYTPHANDPSYMTLLHNPQTTPCKAHDLQTFGNGLYRGDVTEAARLKKALKKKTAREEAFRSRLLSPEPKEKKAKVKAAKRPWPSRPFPKRQKPMKSATP